MNKIKLTLGTTLVAGLMMFASANVMACPDDGDSKPHAAAKPAGPEPKHVATASFKVDGMHCAGCVDHVQDALGKVDGVWKVEVALADKRVTVKFDADKTTAEAIAKAMTAAGYAAAAEV